MSIGLSHFMICGVRTQSQKVRLSPWDHHWSSSPLPLSLDTVNNVSLVLTTPPPPPEAEVPHPVSRAASRRAFARLVCSSLASASAARAAASLLASSLRSILKELDCEKGGRGGGRDVRFEARRFQKFKDSSIITCCAPMSETEGAALQFFVRRTSNDYQERMASSEGSWANQNNNKK